jgi:cAMP-dependent protein kinase regulator
VEVLKDLNSYERGKLCDCLEILKFKEGDKIIKEGQTGNSFYLIMEGNAKAIKRNLFSGESEVVLLYTEKMYFGELSLLNDVPRAATIEATSDIKVARIDRNAFKRILGPLEDILKRNAENYKKFVK